jgi:hypothetical protein
MTVLRTQGVESESPLAFAARQRLLWPLRKQVERLPALDVDPAVRDRLVAATGGNPRMPTDRASATTARRRGCRPLGEQTA